MKTSARFAVLIAATIGLVFLFRQLEKTAPKKEVTTITLELAETYDKRLPTPDKEDIRQILDEASRMVKLKFGDDVRVEFHDNGVVPIETMFKDMFIDDENEKGSEVWDFDPILRITVPRIQQNIYFRQNAIEFLKAYSLESLREFFPGKVINNHEEALDELINTYIQKLSWLKEFRLKNGEPLLISPLPPWQSQVGWEMLMANQTSFDVVITNSFILFDELAAPYPHSICKSAKVGGAQYRNVDRHALGGTAIMTSVFEEYGEVSGLYISDKNITREYRNQIIGGYILAHEFGHAYYRIPDVYDHGGTCLMNSSPSNFDRVEGYKALLLTNSPCNKCMQWVRERQYVRKGLKAYHKKDYVLAGNLYLMAANHAPRRMIGHNREEFIKFICSEAKRFFHEAKDDVSAQSCFELIKQPDP